ncbi:CHAT domain-containing protein [Streptomyces lavendulocolor]|uniref:CHAT domain-containing protein n=1 Tax=Streptomyces lavendulocolor TaxID=67316 RepID=UPI003C2ACB48
MERHISVHIDQTDSDTVRLLYDYGSGGQPSPVAVDATAVQRWIDRAETDYYAELPVDPKDRDRHLRSLVAFGRDLYAFLDTPRRLLSRCGESGARDGSVLVLGISVGHSTARFGHLPWELLHDGDTFVVTAPSPIVPVRRLLTGASVSRAPGQRPLRLVFMACAPDLDTAAPLDYDAEQGRIWERTRRQQIELEVEELGDIDELEERIHRRGAGEIDAVHLTGHAIHTDDGPKFLTEDPMGGARRTGFRDLHRSLAGRSTVVFLSGCRTGEAADAGAVASLAEELAQATAPVVLGWGRPVADVMATKAAAVFYQWLARGEPPTTALARTYREMHATVPYWHMLRMYVRGRAPGPLVVPAAERPVRPVPRDAIIVGEARPGKAEPAFPDPLRFVGRRRQVQQAIRVLHPFTDARAARSGLIVQGMGGIGKTTLVGRVCQRLQDQFRIVILRLRENYLTEEYVRQALTAPEFADMVEGIDDDLPLAQWLGAAFRRHQGNLLFWLDEFETNFRPDRTTAQDIAMVDELPLAQSGAVQVLEALATALGAPQRSDRLVITSRYPLRLPCTARFETITLNPPREDEITRLIHRLRTDGPTALTSEQIAAIREAASDNPRLLVIQFNEARSGTHLTGDLLRVRLRETRDRMVDADLLLPALVDKVNEESVRLLEAATPFCTPVPARALARLVDESAARVMERVDKLAGLNLLERSWQDGAARFVVPLIVRARLKGQGSAAGPAARCAAALAAELGDFLDEPDVRRLDQPLLHELRRLALASGDIRPAVDATLALSEIHSTFGRYGEVAKLCHQLLSHTSEHRLYRTLAEAESELGHSHDAMRYFEHALTQCLPATDRDRAQTLVAVAYHFTFQLPRTPLDQRAAQLREAIGLARRDGAIPGTLSQALRTLARVLATSDDPAEREPVPGLLEEAMDVARGIADGGAEANCVRFDRVCAVLQDRGDFRAAEAELDAIVKAYENLQQPRNSAVALLEAANNWLELEEVDQARSLIKKVDALNRYLQSPRTEVELEMLKGDVAFRQGEYVAAEDHYVIGFESASRMGYEQWELAGLRGRLMCRRSLGDPEGATLLRRDVLRRNQELRSPTYRVDLLLATVEQTDMDSDDQRREVLERAGEAASLARTNGLPGRELRAWEWWCEAADELGVSAAEREAALRRILDLQRNTEDTERTDTLIRLGRLLLTGERFGEARSPLAEALAAQTGDEADEAELRRLLAEAARGSGDPMAAAKELTAVARIRIGLGHHDTAARTLRELAAVHGEVMAPAIAYERLRDARCLARMVPNVELEHQILEELTTLADVLARPGEGLRWQLATESAHLRRAPLRVVVAVDLVRFFDTRQGGVAIEETERIREQIREEDDWLMPGTWYSADENLPPRSYIIYVWGDPVHQGLLPTDHALIPARPPETRTGRVTTEYGISTVEWLTDSEAAGRPTLDPAQVAVRNLRMAARLHRPRLEPYEEPTPPPEPDIGDFTVEQILERLGGV